MSKKFLILKGTAGIGNRLITLANAIAYARITDRIILVDWSDGQFGKKDENVFYKYFRLNNTPHIYSIKDIKNYESLSHYPKQWGLQPHSAVYDLYKQSSSHIFHRIIPLKFSKKGGYWCLKEKQNKTLAQKLFNLLNKNNPPFGSNYRTKMKEVVLFYADFCPPFSPDILRNHIKLSDWLNSEIEDLTSKYQLGRDTVGVHIRMTDKQPDSDLDQLFKKIKDLGLEEKQLFLATDNPKVEDIFQRIFPKLIFLPKWRPEHLGKQMGVHQYAIRNKDYGMAERQLKESIIDMWLLSKCEYLIYQQNSSFSRVSAVLKNEPTKTFSW
jgi:hypothetical protein